MTISVKKAFNNLVVTSRLLFCLYDHMLTNIIQLLSSLYFLGLVNINSTSSVWTKWCNILGQWIPRHSLNIVEMCLENLKDRAYLTKTYGFEQEYNYIRYKSISLSRGTFVSIPYNARIINRSRDDISPIFRPLQIQYIFCMISGNKYRTNKNESLES